MPSRPFVVGLLAFAVVAAACAGSSAGEQPTLPALPAPSAASTVVPTPTRDASGSPTPVQTAPPAAGPTLTQPWATATLTDVRTGSQLRIADLVAAGKVVFLEPMAIWCTKCRAQQAEAVVAFKTLDRDRVVWIGLDVETAEDADQLARYSDQHGFDFSYVIADRDLARALVEDFGDVILNPPATNVIVIGADGTVAHSTGHRSASELVELATTRAG